MGSNLDDDESCNLTQPSDLRGRDARLGALADNGGPTQTHDLLADSPAIDAGDPTGCKDADGQLLQTDQRGVDRPQGRACDLGAVEYRPPSAAGGGGGCALSPTNQTTEASVLVWGCVLMLVRRRRRSTHGLSHWE